MKILLVTDQGDSLGLAYRLHAEGAEIQVFSPKLNLPVDTGYYTPVDNLVKALKDVRFVISDIPSFKFLEEKAKFYNRPIIGCSTMASFPNTHCVHQYRVFEHFDAPVPESRIYEDIGEAIAGLLEWDAAHSILKYENKEVKCD